MTDYSTNTQENTNNFKKDSRFFTVYSLYERGVSRMVEACFNCFTRVSNVEPVTYIVE